MNVESKLKAWKKKMISKSELENMMLTGSDAELCDLVSKAVEDGLLSPVELSGTNGNRTYPVYLKYRITTHNDYTDALNAIAILHPSLTKSGYLQSNPDIYLKNKDALQKLNRYLFAKQSTVPVSRKERSFLVFGEEKQFDNKSFSNVLKRIGLTADVLNYYDTPEYCFNDYIPERKDKMILLICENKDIWFNIRRRMYEDGASEIYNTHIDGVVYGGGNQINKARALSEYTRFMGSKKVKYLYWGDIDRAGLNIYLSLVKNNPQMDIQLFTAAYKNMIDAAGNYIMPDSEDHREIIGYYDELYKLFSENICEKLIGYIDKNKRIPQEIVSYECLLTDMR